MGLWVHRVCVVCCAQVCVVHVQEAMGGMRVLGTLRMWYVSSLCMCVWCVLCVCVFQHNTSPRPASVEAARLAWGPLITGPASLPSGAMW